MKWCAVRNCKSGSRSVSKCSMFSVPKDTVMWKKWTDAIPGITTLNQTDVVCEKHFDENDISREWVKLDANGQIIARATYKRPKLKKLAVPTKFSDVVIGKGNCVPFHEYAKHIPNSHLVPVNDQCASSLRNCTSISSRSIITGESSVPMDVTSCKSSLTDSLAYCKPLEVPSSLKSNEHIARLDSPPPDIGMSFPPMDISSCEPVVADSLSHHEIFKVPSPSEISKQTPEGKESTITVFSAFVPEPWSVGQSRIKNAEYTYFSYLISKMGNIYPCPVIQKCVTLDAHQTLKYFVYGRRVDMPEKHLERVLQKKEMLPNVLEKFKGMRVCNSLGDIDIHLVRPGEAYQDCVEKWRSKYCSLLSKNKRCDSCVKSRRCLQQRAARFRNQPTIKRIGRVSNPVDRQKLVALQKKIRHERCQKIGAKVRVKHLMACMKAREEHGKNIKSK